MVRKIPSIFKSIYNQYLPFFRSRVSHFQPKQLEVIIKKEAEKAQKRYLKLKEPKISPPDLYIVNWIKNRVNKDLVRKLLLPENLPEREQISFPLDNID